MALKEMSAQQAFEKLATLCARGEHCQHEMVEKMRQWGVSDEAQAEVMARLTSGRYVDDERYVRAFVHDKLAYNQWGRRKIEQALRLKHIDEATLRAVLDETDDSAYADVLRPLLRQKRKSTKGKSDYEVDMKLVRWAMSRGFTMDVIRQCMAVEGDEEEFLD